jgi:hypothetical protein
MYHLLDLCKKLLEEFNEYGISSINDEFSPIEDKEEDDLEYHEQYLGDNDFDAKFTLLEMAVKHYEHNLVKLFLDKGANINHQNSISGNTPLHHIREHNMLILLLKYQPDLTLKNKEGESIMDRFEKYKLMLRNKPKNEVIPFVGFYVSAIQKHLEVNAIKNKPQRNLPSLQTLAFQQLGTNDLHNARQHGDFKNSYQPGKLGGRKTKGKNRKESKRKQTKRKLSKRKI